MVVPTVISLLMANADVVKAVGDRVYPVAIPQTEKRPSIVVAISGNTQTESYQGASEVDLLNFIIYLVGTTYASVDLLSHKVRKVLEVYRGNVIDTIRYLTENDQEYDQDNRLYSKIVTYRVRVKR